METNPQHLCELLEKYADNRCSKEEFNELLGIVRNGEKEVELVRIVNELWTTKATKTDNTHDWDKVIRNLKKQTSNIKVKKVPAIIHANRWQVAAIMAITITVCTLMWNYVRESNELSTQIAVLQQAQQEAISTNTYIALGDGSTVVLSPGSSLDYPAEFTGDTREVILHGEAYFDIEHDPTKPFIIHTGTVKTTVLGTSFSIKVEPDGSVVTVIVTKGVVRVEEKVKQVQLAELHENEKLVYDMSKKEVSAQPVNAQEAIEWILVDMAYTDLRFGDICKVLEKRYNVNIRFENPDMASKHITATFDGTERLESVLQILCDTQNAEYTKENDIIYIR